MSTIVPEATSSPVFGSWNVDPGGSTMNWPTRPWPHAWMPSTWSCQKMLSSWTSGYQRYCVNSMPAPCPGRARCRGAVERDRGRVVRHDLPDLDALGALADRDELAVLELRRARERQDPGPAATAAVSDRVLDRVRPDRLLERHAGDHAVRRLGVELDVVDVHVHLRERRLERVALLVGERHRDAVADVAADARAAGRACARPARRPCPWPARRSCRWGRCPRPG